MARERGCVVVAGTIASLGGAVLYGLTQGVNQAAEPLRAAATAIPEATQVVSEAAIEAMNANITEWGRNLEAGAIGLMCVAIPVAMLWVWRRSRPRMRLKGEAKLAAGPYDVAIVTTHPGAFLPGMKVKVEQEHPEHPGVFIPPEEAERITELLGRLR